MRKTLLFLLVFIGLYAFNLSDISVSGTEGNTIVEFTFDGEVSYTDFTMDGKIVIDLLNTKGLEGKTWDVNNGGIKNIQISEIPSGDILRVIVSCDQEYSYTIAQEDSKLVMEISTGTEDFGPMNIGGAETIPPVEETEVKETETTETQEEVTPPTRVVKKKGISMEFENADMTTALRAIAEYAGMNIVIGDDVKGTVTLKLDNIYWEDALRLILQTKGYAYVIEGNVIRVGTGKQFEAEREARELAEPMEQKVIVLEFTTAREIEKVIKNQLSKRGSMDIDERTNSIIVKDIKSKVEQIESLIRILDTKTPQVAIEAKVVDMDKGVLNDLGIQWSVKNLRNADWNLMGSVGSSQLTGPISGLALTLGTIKNFALLSSSLKALETENKLTTLANPRITTANNKKAEIFGGKKFAITTLDMRGNPITQWFNAGIKLNVTPHINSLQDITMDVEVELSDVISEKEITTTNAKTQALVKDGETLVIGGFIHKTQTKRVEGIPILRSIPIIGALFRRTYTEDRDREVLIFLTPHIVKSVF